MNYTEFRTQIFQYYTQQDFNAALAVIQAEAANFPEHAVRILYWQACVEGLAGLPEAALRSLQALADQNLWYRPEDVRGDPDLAVLQGKPEFEAVLTKFAELQAAELGRTRPELLVYAPPENAAQPYPLLIAIHGRNDNAGSFAGYYHPLAEQGWLVALPQSSDILASKCYGWDDREKGEAELAAHFADLCSRYPIDPQRIVLSGFSQGGGLSIWLAVSGMISAIGFLAFAPYLHGIASLEASLSPAAGLRGWIFTGDQDRNQEMFAHFTSLLNQARVPFERRRYPEMAHEMPPDHADIIPQALNALVSSKIGDN